MLDAALKALFGTRKLALDGGAIHFVILPDRFRSALFWLFVDLTVNAKEGRVEWDSCDLLARRTWNL
jgi:hypothetical protein